MFWWDTLMHIHITSHHHFIIIIIFPGNYVEVGKCPLSLDGTIHVKQTNTSWSFCPILLRHHIASHIISYMHIRVSHQNMFFWNKKIPTQSLGIWVVAWRIPKGFLISTTFRGCTRLSKIWPLHRGQFIKCDSNAEVYLISETMTQASMAKSLR